MNYDQQKELQRYKNKVSNAQGQYFEEGVKAACEIYRQRGAAYIQKTPEPFRVLRKEQKGRALVQFSEHAEPDFKGCLNTGRLVVIETKYTGTDRMKQNVLTEKQAEDLNTYSRFGAIAAVCVGIKEKHYFVPYEIWRCMKEIWGRKYVTQEDLEPYRVQFNGAVLFLHYVQPEQMQLGKLWKAPQEVTAAAEDVLHAVRGAVKDKPFYNTATRIEEVGK